MTPYYEDGRITIYHGDCREITAWLDADVLVTDPPYGMRFQSNQRQRASRLPAIIGDLDPTTRDDLLLRGPSLCLVRGCPRVLVPTASTGHPTPKPVGLIERLLERCPPGAIADPFMGSGSTLVAANTLGRRAIGIEIDERYCEIAARRLDQGVLDLTSEVPA
jgi:site-specific DNA-methyltransferase (adenine-specific)